MYKMNLGSDWKLRSEELNWGAGMLPAVMSKEEGWISTDLPCDVTYAIN